MSFRIIRRVLQNEPSHEVYVELCRILDQWQAEEPISLAIEYINEHFQWNHANRTPRSTFQLSKKFPPHWELVRAFEMSRKSKVPKALYANTKQFREITHARFIEPRLQSDIDFLEGFEKLEEFTMQHCNSLQNLDGLSSHSSLKKLELTHCYRLKSIQGLTKHKNLQELSLLECHDLEGLKGLENIQQLTKLEVTGYLGPGLQEVITQNQALRSITFYAKKHPEIEEITRQICSISALESLKLPLNPILEDCSLLKNLPNLKKLVLYHCKNLRSLAGLEELQQLESIDLQACNALIDVSALKTLPKLNHLNLFACKNLSSDFANHEVGYMTKRDQIVAFQQTIKGD